jgi:hypothetical protein
MISYCAVMIRPKFVRMLVADLVRKTKMPFEILLWMNVEDRPFEVYVTQQARAGVPIKIVGKTPENIGMRALKDCFQQAKGTIITQIDDDVIEMSAGTPEAAQFIFEKRPGIRHLSAMMWEDKYCYFKPPWIDKCKSIDPAMDLYHGPIDGWFSMYHRDLRDLLLSFSYDKRALSTGWIMSQRLGAKKDGPKSALCRAMKVFHVKAPAYLNYYDLFETQLWKFEQLGQKKEDIERYRQLKARLPAKAVVEPYIQKIHEELDKPVQLPCQK